MLRVRKVILGISGGVDSAVAGVLLKKKGFEVHGVYMRNWDELDEHGQCGVAQDMEDAAYACKKLDIPFQEVNFVKEYWNNVFMYTLDYYENGLTPNPDIMCNKFIKFDSFLNYAIKKMGADAIATGHYARTSYGTFLENKSPKLKLLKAADQNKDQTFFLCQVNPEAFKKTIFPLGDLNKQTVKKIACENGLERIASKPESTGMCFIGSRKFSNFMSEYVKPKPGRFIDIRDGKVLGTHNGYHLYTVGQRSSLPGKALPYYIVKKMVDSGDILVAAGINDSSTFADLLYTTEPHWISEPIHDPFGFECDFRFQHRRPVCKCYVMPLKSGLVVKLENPLRALTAGQFAVFYRGDECLGSACITAPGPSYRDLLKSIENDYEEYPQQSVAA